MPRKKGPDDEDGMLWDYITRDVAPLHPRKRSAPAPTARPAISRGPGSRPAPAPAPPAAPAKPGPQARDLDRRTRQKLTRGQMDIEAVLDLHGHGRDAAREELIAFVCAAQARDMRCVLVITGKGKAGTGVLRSHLPRWLDEPPLSAIVLEAVPARQGHGGHGAFYVLLRRRRL